MVGILVSFWDGPFSGAMLVLGRVRPAIFPGGAELSGPFLRTPFKIQDSAVARLQEKSMENFDRPGASMMARPIHKHTFETQQKQRQKREIGKTNKKQLKNIYTSYISMYNLFLFYSIFFYIT